MYQHANLIKFNGQSMCEYRYTTGYDKGPWCMHDLPYDQPCITCKEISIRNSDSELNFLEKGIF